MFRWGSEGGNASGQQAIKKRDEAEASESSGTNMIHKLVQVYPVGDDICAFTDYSVMMWKGHRLMIYVRDADTWKIRMAYAIDCGYKGTADEHSASLWYKPQGRINS